MEDKRTELDKLHARGIALDGLARRSSDSLLSRPSAAGGPIADLVDATLEIISVNETGLDQKQSETQPG